MPPEIKDVTFGLDGDRLQGWQAAQRLYAAGFTDAKALATALAVMAMESGYYLKAWHHNIVRDGDGNIVRDANGAFTVMSTDLGFVQRNVPHSPFVKLTDDESGAFVDNLFLEHPELARGDSSAKIAHSLYEQRGWQPWVAYSSGNYKKALADSCVAVANLLGLLLLDNRNVAARK
jgi:hypothetical protein